MKLVDVYADDGPSAATVILLWELLAQREPHESISHRRMPEFEEHCRFVVSRPYTAWYVLQWREARVGAVYLSRQREVGIAILKRHRGLGLASLALCKLARKHPGPLLANINPANEASIALFRKHGFGGPIQITLEKQ